MKKIILFTVWFKRLVAFLSLFLFLSLTSYASELVYTIQTGSFTHINDAQQQYDSILQEANLKQLNYLRIEKVGDYYSVRVGNFENWASAVSMLKGMNPAHSKALILQAYIKDERIKKLYRGEEKKPSESLSGKSEPPIITTPVKQAVTELPAAEISVTDKHGGEDKLLPIPEPAKNNLSDSEKPDNSMETKAITAEQSKMVTSSATSSDDFLMTEEPQLTESEDLDFDLDMEDLDIEDDMEYSFVEIKPEASLYAGYRFIDISGSKRAFEYEYDGNFPAFGGDLISLTYPHKYHFDLEVKNDKDYLSDFRYAYKSTVNFRLFNSTFYHNLDNIQLVDLDPLTLSPDITINDGNKDYGLRTGINDLYLKLKKPDHPTHLYVKGFHVFKDGKQQQRSLLGSGYFNDMDLTTQSRDIDNETMTYTAGINSHLGHLEADYSHTEKRFNVSSDEILIDTYVSGSATRPSGVFPHNQLSELKSSSDKIRLHTNYSGRISASLTLSRKHRENRTSKANDDILIGEGAVRWTPLSRLSVLE